jgi:hypothetical protein
MDTRLVVVRSFGGFARGDIVSDSILATRILNSGHVRFVVRVVKSSSKET